MVKELIEKILQPLRPSLLETKIGTLLFNDAEKKYRSLIDPLKRSVSNVESLALVVLEEGKRRDRKNGNDMTVILTESGGFFFPDDTVRLDEWTFQRQCSQQWRALVGMLNRPMDHVTFLRSVQMLKPSIAGFQDLFRGLRRVQLGANTTVMSAPIVDAGQAGSSISFLLTAEAGGPGQKASMPGDFQCRMPFVKGSEKEYEFTVEIEVRLGGKEGKQVEFALVFPDRELIIEQALRDEVAFFKESVKSMTELLVLLDY